MSCHQLVHLAVLLLRRRPCLSLLVVLRHRRRHRLILQSLAETSACLLVPRMALLQLQKDAGSELLGLPKLLGLGLLLLLGLACFPRAT